MLNQGQIIVEKMTRDDFHKKAVRGVMQSMEFSMAASFHVENITDDQKMTLRESLEKIGIPLECTVNDDDLEDIITTMLGRSVELR